MFPKEDAKHPTRTGEREHVEKHLLVHELLVQNDSLEGRRHRSLQLLGLKQNQEEASQPPAAKCQLQ